VVGTCQVRRGSTVRSTSRGNHKAPRYAPTQRSVMGTCDVLRHATQLDTAKQPHQAGLAVKESSHSGALGVTTRYSVLL
jgi:hypothetical protein